jgi:hypothetical protein
VNAHPLMRRRAGVVNGSPGHAVLDSELDSGVCPAVTYGKQRLATMNDWPLKSYLGLGALPSAASCARLHAKHRLWEWGLEDFSDSVELVVSELITNGLKASVGLIGSRIGGKWRPGVPPIRLWLCSDKERVLIQVWDGNDRMPEAENDDPLGESGRGLLLVEALCVDWGTFRPEGDSGKVVWGVIADQ